MSEQSDPKNRSAMSRRAFIGTGVMALGGSMVWGLGHKSFGSGVERFPASEGKIRKSSLISSFAIYPQDPAELKKWDPDNGGFLRILSLESGLIETIPAAVAAHVFNQHPTKPNLFLGAAKHAKGAAVVDVDAKKNIAHLLAPHRFQLYGHSAFSADGKFAYLSAHNEDTNQGAICVFDCEDWKLVKTVPSGGGRPHELFLADDNHIVVTNEVGKDDPMVSTISYLRTSDLEIERSWSVPTVAHAMPMGPGRAVFCGFVGTAPTNFISLDMKTGKYKSFLDHPEIAALKIVGEGLSLCQIEENVVAMSVPEAKMIVIWDLAKDSIRTVDANHVVTGIAELNGQVYVNDNRNHLFQLAVGGIPRKIEQASKMEYANGRHIKIYKV